MSLENKKEWNVNELDLTKKSKQQTTQILLEGDGIVPENKPDLSNIIHFSGEILKKSIKISENQFNYIGELSLDILYYCNNSTYGIYSMKALIPINETLYLDDLENDEETKINVMCKLVHIECNMINDRKVSIKAVADFSFYSEKSVKQKIIEPISSDDNSMAFLEEVINIERIVDTKKDCYKVKEEVVIDDKMPPIGEVLRVRSKITDKEIRPVEEKVMIHCNIIVDALYRDNDGLCHVFRSKIPFHTYIDSKFVSPKSDINLELIISKNKIEVSIDNDGEARILEIELDIDADMKAFSNEDLSLITDAYIPNKVTTVKKEEFSYTIPVGIGENQFHIREKVSLNNELPTMMQAENSWGEVVVENISIENGVVEISGLLNSEIIYLSGEDNAPLHIFMESVPFSQRVELNGIEENDDLYINASVEEIDFQIYSGRDGELISRILLEVVGKRNILGETIVDIDVSDAVSDNKRSAGAVIYTVQDDDSLWNIAKTHNTTVADVMDMNGIEKVVAGESVLIFRS